MIVIIHHLLVKVVLIISSILFDRKDNFRFQFLSLILIYFFDYGSTFQLH